MVYDEYMVRFMTSIWYGYDEYMIWFMMSIWYGL